MKPQDDRAGSETTLLLPWRSLPRTRRRDAAPVWCREALGACGAFEWVALAYLGVSGLLMVMLQTHLPRAPLRLAAHAGVAALVVGLSWAAQRWPSRELLFARHWYPQAFFLFCFEELHYLVHLVFPGWFDRWLIAFDSWLVGVHPTVWL